MAAVRDKNVVRLYIDGRLNSSSTTFAEADYDISNRSQFLMGFGPTVLFLGGMDDIRLYRGALDASQVQELCKRLRQVARHEISILKKKFAAWSGPVVRQ